MDNLYCSENATTLTSARFSKVKRTINTLIAVLFLLSWSYLAIVLNYDLSNIVSLPIPIGIVLVCIIITYMWGSKFSLSISSQGIISGTATWRKSFSLNANNIQSVVNSGINGICIRTNSGKKYHFGFMDNRDEICKKLSELGITVDETLLSDEYATIVSKLDLKAHKIHKKLCYVFYILFNIFLSVSAIWYQSPYNSTLKTTTSYYYYGNYKIPYETRYWGMIMSCMKCSLHIML